MKPITAGLVAAQKSASSRPHVQALLTAHWGNARQLRNARHYTGAEDELWTAVCLPADGSLVRARIDASGRLWASRVASPGPASTYSSWTDLGLVSGVSGVALVATAATVRLFRKT